MPSIDRFVLAIVAVVLLAYIFPYWGTDSGPLPLREIGTLGVALIFFFYGLKLSKEKLTAGLKNWKLHLLVQSSTFLLFPLLVIPFYALVHQESLRLWWVAFLFLAALPSTVSSSVVMVSMAGGNIPAAIFNASISGLIGIVITPLWMKGFLPEAAGTLNIGSVYLKLLLEIILPVVLGLLMQPLWGKYAVQYGSSLATFDKSVILLIIFRSFAESFEAKIFATVGWVELGMVSLAVLLLFFVVFMLTGFLSKQLGFTAEDQITAQYCGTKKSLVHGTVFSKILFPPSFPVGVVLLPLMLFHAFQIFIISVLATRRGKS